MAAVVLLVLAIPQLIDSDCGYMSRPESAIPELIVSDYGYMFRLQLSIS